MVTKFIYLFINEYLYRYKNTSTIYTIKIVGYAVFNVFPVAKALNNKNSVYDKMIKNLPRNKVKKKKKTKLKKTKTVKNQSNPTAMRGD